jgi:AraC-like DNA-binding protein
VKKQDHSGRSGFAVGTVPARYLRELAHRLAHIGFDIEPPLKLAGLSLATLNHPQARIGRQQLSHALQGLAKATGRTDLGFELGAIINIATTDVVGQLILNSPTLATGLASASRYFALVTPSYRLHVDVAREVYRLRCEPTLPLPYDVAVMGLEILAVSMHRLAVFLTQEKSVVATLEASWAAPLHAARYRELKGLKVRFATGDSPHFVMALPPSLMEAPLPMANSLAAEEIEGRCKQMLEEITREHSWTQWVTMMLRSVEGHFPSQGELAAMMRISNRTMARGLASEGVEYRALSMGTRHARAMELLQDTSLGLAEIAHRLGYSDAANFSRAFRKQEACSPGEHRKR